MANNTESLFLRIPLEVRLMIYEHATYVGKIKPKQVVQRSNKFVWGDYIQRFAHDHPSRALEVKLPMGEPLVFPKLLETCRQIRDELRRHPVFYRVNSFRFNGYQSLHSFLAALTPTRRDMIRWIEFSTECWSGIEVLAKSCDYPAVPRYRYDVFYSSHALALLAQCRQLREFKVVEHYKPRCRWYHATPERIWIMTILNICRHAAKFDSTTLTYFSLPGFKLIMDFREQCPLMIDLFDGQPLRNIPKGTTLWLKDGHLISQINEVKAIVFDYKQTILSNSPGLKAMIGEEMLRESVREANLDFPGDARMTGDRNDIPGPISKRTRGRARGHKDISKWGTLNDGIRPKYDMEGRLVWNFTRINNVRWSDMATIECEVVWQYPGDFPSTSWEELHALVGRFGLCMLDDFYSREWATRAKDDDHAAKQLQIFETLPKPKDVIRAIQTLLIDEGNYVRTQEYKNRIRRWMRWDALWNKAIRNYRISIRKEESQEGNGSITVGARRNSRAQGGNGPEKRRRCKGMSEPIKDQIFVKPRTPGPQSDYIG